MLAENRRGSYTFPFNGMRGVGELLQKIRRTIAVAAGKGGVGKSTVAVNLGLLLRRQGYTVGILDADLYGPSIRRMLPEERLPRQSGEKVIPALSQSGILTISMAYLRQEGEAAVLRAPIANQLIQRFMRHVEWGELDYLIIDFPPGTGDIQLTLCQQAHLTGAIMVTTPQEVAVMDVKKAMHLFDQVSVPVIGVVENMSYYYHAQTGERIALFGNGGGDGLARQSGVAYLGAIPLDPAVSISGDNGTSLFDDEKTSGHLIDAYCHVAHQMEEQLALIEQHQGNFSFELLWEEMP